MKKGFFVNATFQNDAISATHTSFYFIYVSIHTNPVFISEHNYNNMYTMDRYNRRYRLPVCDIMWIIIIVLSCCELIGRLFSRTTRVKSLQDFTRYHIATSSVVSCCCCCCCCVVVVGCYCHCMVPVGVHYRDHEITTAQIRQFIII